MTKYAVGDKVIVSWLEGDVEATVAEVLLVNGKPHKTPHYRLTIVGVTGRLGYREYEMRPAEEPGVVASGECAP